MTRALSSLLAQIAFAHNDPTLGREISTRYETAR